MTWRIVASLGFPALGMAIAFISHHPAMGPIGLALACVGLAFAPPLE